MGAEKERNKERLKTHPEAHPTHPPGRTHFGMRGAGLEGRGLSPPQGDEKLSVFLAERGTESGSRKTLKLLGGIQSALAYAPRLARPPSEWGLRGGGGVYGGANPTAESDGLNNRFRHKR